MPLKSSGQISAYPNFRQAVALVIPSAPAGNTGQWLSMARVKPKPTTLSPKVGRVQIYCKTFDFHRQVGGKALRFTVARLRVFALRGCAWRCVARCGCFLAFARLLPLPCTYKQKKIPKGDTLQKKYQIFLIFLNAL